MSKPKKIFIVDDEEMLTAALEDYLTRETAHQIRSFGTGEECLRHLDEKPDIIILDYYLNTISKEAANGMEILKAIRKHDHNVHIIMLSYQENYGVAMQALQKGAEQYVVKDKDAFGKIDKMINEFA